MSKKIENPTFQEALKKPAKEKLEVIEYHFKKIMETLGLDISDDSLKDTPKRVAKMYVNEIFSGLLEENKPSASHFDNKYDYQRMLVEKNIAVYSTCEHHFLPIVGVAHIAYISCGRVIGLSKINRIVDYYAKRPQVQERMTIQIVQHLSQALQTPHVACLIDAKHLCVNSRGIRDVDSSTVTSHFLGDFEKKALQKEFFTYLKISPIRKV